MWVKSLYSSVRWIIYVPCLVVPTALNLSASSVPWRISWSQNSRREIFYGRPRFLKERYTSAISAVARKWRRPFRNTAAERILDEVSEHPDTSTRRIINSVSLPSAANAMPTPHNVSPSCGWVYTVSWLFSFWNKMAHTSKRKLPKTPVITSFVISVCRTRPFSGTM
jgi:hypothetical protein